MAYFIGVEIGRIDPIGDYRFLQPMALPSVYAIPQGLFRKGTPNMLVQRIVGCWFDISGGSVEQPGSVFTGGAMAGWL